MAQISIINIKDIIQAKRFDAEYFKPEYLEIERKIKSNNFDLVKYIFEPIKNGIDYREFVEKGNRKYIRTADIKNYGYTETAVDILLDEVPEKVKLKKEDILFTRKGNYGKNCIVDNEILENALISSEIMLLRKKDNTKYNTYYLSIFLRSKFGQQQIERNVHGVSNFSITQEALENLKIPLLPQSFQLQIEKIVKEAYEKQSLSKELYKEAEQILLEELDLKDFKPKHKLTFTTTKKEIEQAKRFDAEYFQPKYEEIIEKIKSYNGGFEKLENFIEDYSTGYPFKSESYQNIGIPLIRINNIGKGNLDIENVAFIPEKDINLSLKDVAKEDDILISMSGTIGNSCKIPKNVEAVVNQRIFRFTPKKFDPDVLSLFINSIMGYSQLIRIGTGGVQTNISGNDIIKILIPLVPNYIQQKISQKIQESFKLRKEAKELLEKAKKMVEKEIEKANPKQNI